MAGDPVGLPVLATDADNETQTYPLGGADEDSFDIDGGTGQITVGAATVLNYEDTDNTDHQYEVTVTVRDTSGANMDEVIQREEGYPNG